MLRQRTAECRLTDCLSRGVQSTSKTITLDSNHPDFLALLWRNGGTKAAQQRTKTIAEGLSAEVQKIVNQPDLAGLFLRLYELRARRAGGQSLPL